MKTTELIKQAEELLRVHDNAFTNERDEAIIAAFARNHMQEIIDKLKRYEETLNWIYQRPSFGFGAVPFYVREAARQALEGE